MILLHQRLADVGSHTLSPRLEDFRRKLGENRQTANDFKVPVSMYGADFAQGGAKWKTETA